MKFRRHRQTKEDRNPWMLRCYRGAMVGHDDLVGQWVLAAGVLPCGAAARIYFDPGQDALGR